MTIHSYDDLAVFASLFVFSFMIILIESVISYNSRNVFTALKLQRSLRQSPIELQIDDKDDIKI